MQKNNDLLNRQLTNRTPNMPYFIPFFLVLNFVKTYLVISEELFKKKKDLNISVEVIDARPITIKV